MEIHKKWSKPPTRNAALTHQTNRYKMGDYTRTLKMCSDPVDITILLRKFLRGLAIYDVCIFIYTYDVCVNLFF